MYEIYKRIEDLCNSTGVNVTTMCKESGVPRSALSDYKAGRIKSLSTDKLQKIATYFNVSVDYLLGNEQKEKPATDSDGFTEKERRDIAIEVERMMADLENQGDLMFDGDPATPEALQTIRTAFEIGLTNARRLNKEKQRKKE